MVSAHTNLGTQFHTSRCRETSTGDWSVRNQVIGDKVNKAHWDCDQSCMECGFELSDVTIQNCHNYKPNVNVIFTRTIDPVDYDA